MSELTNLTDRLAHLRDRKGNSTTLKGTTPPSQQVKKPKLKTGERKFAPDSFMLFVYGLAGIALIAQMILIVWLDVI